MSEFEWSESGLELLRRIAGLILKNGGNIRYALDIEKEWLTGYRLEKAKKRLLRWQRRAWSQTEIQFLQANLHLSYEDLALQMKERTEDAVRQKIWYLQKAKILGSKWEAKNEYKQLNK